MSLRRILGIALLGGAVDRMIKPDEIPSLRAAGRILLILGVGVFIAGKYLAAPAMPAVGFFCALLGLFLYLCFYLSGKDYGSAAVIILTIVIALAVAVTVNAAEPPTSIYHEASCPSVQLRPMTRVKRADAITRGVMPAPDCHPDLVGHTSVTYLGTLNLPPSPTSSPVSDRVQVRAYTKDDGTQVRAHDRARPGSKQ